MGIKRQTALAAKVMIANLPVTVLALRYFIIAPRVLSVDLLSTLHSRLATSKLPLFSLTKARDPVRQSQCECRARIVSIFLRSPNTASPLLVVSRSLSHQHPQDSTRQGYRE